MARFVATYGPNEARIRNIESHLALLGDSPINAAQEANAIILTVKPGTGAQFVSLDTLDDTNLFSPADGDALIYDGAAWVNSAAYITTAPLTATRNTISAGAGIEPLILNILDTGGGADSPALRPVILTLRHRTTLTTVPGVGSSIDWVVPDNATTDIAISRMIGEITGVTAGATEATVGWTVQHQGQSCEVARFRGQTGLAATVAVAFDGYIGGQFWVRGDFLAAAGFSARVGFGAMGSGILCNITKDAAAATPTNVTYLQVLGVADTAMTASTEAPDIVLNLGRTVQFATGALTNQRAVKILAPTYGFVAASTLTAAATLYVDNAPQPGTNATLTTSYSIWIDAGLARFDGNGTHVFEFGLNDTSALGAFYGRVPVSIPGVGTKYLPLYS